MHILAIYIQLGPTDPKYQNHEKLARFYHRLAWLFRENVYVGKYSEAEELLNTFTMLYDNYQSAFLNSLSTFEKLKEWWAETLESEKQGALPETLSPFEMEIKIAEKEIGRLLDHLLLNNPKIYEIITKFKEKYIKTNELILDQQYYDFTSYHAFLQQLKKEWPLAPVDEMTALNQAAEFYKKMVSSNTFVGETIKLYKAYELIMAIYAKMQQPQSELEILLKAYKHAFDFKQKAKERIRVLQGKEDTPAHMISHMKSMIRRIDDMLLTWKNRKAYLMQKIFEKDREKARNILAKLGDSATLQEKISALKEAHIHKSVIQEFHHELAPEQKGLFKKLFGS
jgi:hypothetical protein